MMMEMQQSIGWRQHKYEARIWTAWTALTRRETSARPFVRFFRATSHRKQQAKAPSKNSEGTSNDGPGGCSEVKYSSAATQLLPSSTRSIPASVSLRVFDLFALLFYARSKRHTKKVAGNNSNKVHQASKFKIRCMHAGSYAGAVLAITRQ